MKILFVLLSVAAVVLYPLLIHLGITHFSGRQLSLILLALIGVRFLAAAKHNKKRIKAYIPFAAVAVFSVAIVFFSNNAKLLLHIPTLINVALACVFLYSYLRPPTVIENLARADFPVMPQNAITYCTRVTLIWCASFLVCAAICFYLAEYGSRNVWIIWCSVGIYAYHGTVFGLEYLVRRTQVPAFERAAQAMQAAKST